MTDEKKIQYQNHINGSKLQTVHQKLGIMKSQEANAGPMLYIFTHVLSHTNKQKQKLTKIKISRLSKFWERQNDKQCI